MSHWVSWQRIVWILSRVEWLRLHPSSKFRPRCYRADHPDWVPIVRPVSITIRFEFAMRDSIYPSIYPSKYAPTCPHLDDRFWSKIAPSVAPWDNRLVGIVLIEIHHVHMVNHRVLQWRPQSIVSYLDMVSHWSQLQVPRSIVVFPTTIHIGHIYRMVRNFSERKMKHKEQNKSLSRTLTIRRGSNELSTVADMMIWTNIYGVYMYEYFTLIDSTNLNCFQYSYMY